MTGNRQDVNHLLNDRQLEIFLCSADQYLSLSCSCRPCFHKLLNDRQLGFFGCQACFHKLLNDRQFGFLGNCRRGSCKLLNDRQFDHSRLGSGYFLLEKVRRGGQQTIDFFPKKGSCFYCSVYSFPKILGGAKVVLGASPAPCSRKPEYLPEQLGNNNILQN